MFGKRSRNIRATRIVIFGSIFTVLLTCLTVQGVGHAQIMNDTVVHSHLSQTVSPRAFQKTSPEDPWNPDLVGKRYKMTYETVDGVSETLYVFEPEISVYKQAPVVVYLHGGSLLHGSAVIGYDNQNYNPHDWIISHIEAGLVSRGFVFVTVNYRLAPAFKWPTQLIDAKTAIRFLRAHATELHIDQNRIGVMGDSAGGGLANFVGLTGHRSGYNQGLWSNQSSAVSAVVDMFGPSTRKLFAQHWLSAHGDSPNPIFGVYTHHTIQRESAISYTGPYDPPFLILQGKKDTVEPPYQSIELYRRLLAVGDRAQLILIQNSQHEFRAVGGPLWPTIPMLTQDVISFFEQTLSG
ncbi:MAG: alpha/beta hydrolase fold domain-containing protein [Bacilli bacterium]